MNVGVFCEAKSHLNSALVFTKESFLNFRFFVKIFVKKAIQK
jgi:hypothetical protein